MKAAAATPRSFRAAGTTEALRAAALGANLWAIALLLPVLHGGARAIDAVIVLVPLLPLAIGTRALGSPVPRLSPVTQRGLAIATLLFAFPITLASAIASRADLADRDAWGPLGLLVASISLLAFGAVSAEACGRPVVLRTSSAQGLATVQPASEPPLRRWLRRAIVGGVTAGALLAAVVAPAIGARATLVRTWGDSADEATVLASIVGAAAGSIGLAAFVGPRLRAPRAGELPSASRRALRVSIAMLLAAAALVAFFLLRAWERSVTT
ncbi:hypothetical protein [Sandaracinus amylolyticus]|uniref:hypothetical protein n=1 Tax=Sandaracinus amylolyticus TaxID=927083 RepID=UPI001F42A65F|nr:hypothetical protein [Sandaracinus amylolyticus]UJR82755.1 Hypothetical protein I5071_48200 [Sandaracinus amylolyticus]